MELEDSTMETVCVPVGGNTFITRPGPGNSEYVDDNGLHSWSSGEAVITTYLRLRQAGTVTLAISAVVPSAGISVVAVTVGGQRFLVNLDAQEATVYSVGTVQICSPGYVRVDFEGLSRTGPFFAEIRELILGGSCTTAGVDFAAPSEDPFHFYFCRRGPSVHLSYQDLPPETEWVYTEVTVPPGADVIGMYAMANGFTGGYFGIQVNGSTERRILFSVWDPEDGAPTRAVKVGQGVVSRTFGGEGTGQQTFFVFPWVAGNTYRFVTRVRPHREGGTDYSAWFYAPETGAWKFVATLHRPATSTWYSGAHSFLENFNPETGHVVRMALLGNQWALSEGTGWVELKTSMLTADVIAEKRQRLDYAGGVRDGQFFLKNCGFFDDTVDFGQYFTRPATGVPPELDLAALPLF